MLLIYLKIKIIKAIAPHFELLSSIKDIINLCILILEIILDVKKYSYNNLFEINKKQKILQGVGFEPTSTEYK